MFALSKYWTWGELCDRWGIKKTEVFDFLKKGLQIYTDMGDLEHCPGKFHRYGILMAKQHSILTPAQIYNYLPDDPEPKDSVLPNHTDEDIKKAESKALEFISKVQRNKFLKIKNEMSAIHKDDPQHVLWKYFEMPESHGDRRDLLFKYKDCLFNIEEVVKSEEINNMKPAQTAESVKKPIRTDSEKKRDKLINMFREAQPEVEKLYSVVLFKFGYKAHESDEKLIQDLVLHEFNGNINFYKIIKENYLADINLYKFSRDKSKRDFIGKLLLKISKDRHLGFNSYQNLYKMYLEFKRTPTNID